MNAEAIILKDLGISNVLGQGRQAVWQGLMAASRQGMVTEEAHQSTWTLGRMIFEPRFHSRGGQDFMECLGLHSQTRMGHLLDLVCEEIRPTIEALKPRVGPRGIAVVIGSTDNGAEESFQAMKTRRETGTWPAGYRLYRQSAQLPAHYVQAVLGCQGIALTISTACASSASAMLYGRRLLDAGMCDVVVAGGADIVSPSVLLGFASLEAVDHGPCQPFSANRRGINLGEGAALFVMCRSSLDQGVPTPWALAAFEGPLALLGGGESSDAHHMTAPDPSGAGARLAMERALANAGLQPSQVDYLNLHGTGTAHNDSMESLALAGVFPAGVPCSSTKALMGHTLGAAGAGEAGLCALALSGLNPQNYLPPHIWDGVPDPRLPVLDLVQAGRRLEGLRVAMSNSYAFGGCNVSLLLGLARAADGERKAPGRSGNPEAEVPG